MSDAHQSAWIIETSDERFAQDVIARSSEVPVVVDFWAEWCGPCRMLGPVLEQLAEEYGGAFVLVKADTEQNPQAAAEFRVQSIPAVYAVRDGQVIDGFLGARPAEEIRHWLGNILPSLAEMLTREGLELLPTDAATAVDKLLAAQAADDRYAPAQIALADAYCQLQDFTRAQEVIAQLEARGFLEPEAERVKARLELHSQAATAAPVAECRQRAAAEPDRLDLKLDLADALAGSAVAAEKTVSITEALDLCLGVIRQDRGELRERARRTMVDIFRLLPDDSEIVGTYRRHLAMALY
ncbi:MAG: tetratricopeptide repeat protein [Planctomycetales bacterium]|nr:tetratricopeptide repeat protein [Planctomycetales bacterium]